jgi:hypothetical protein
MNSEVVIPTTTDVGALGVFHLKRLWSRVTRRSVDQNSETDEWLSDRVVIDGLGLALEETLQYLGRTTPTYEQFEQWILECNGGEIEPLRIERINATISGEEYSDELQAAIRAIENSAPVLTPEDLSFWDTNGYVVLHNAVATENCRAAEAAIWESLGMDSGDPDTWYKANDHGIMRQLFHHPALAANRRSSRIHKAFAQIWGSADLWMTVDRVSFNPPERDDWQFPGPLLHWDVTLAAPIPFSVSALLYLTDTDAQQGAFTCVVGFHRRIDEWLKSLPPDVDPRTQNLEELGPLPIAGRAGDLIIWNEALPHGSRPNHATRPRIVQYLTMRPAQRDHNPDWK